MKHRSANDLGFTMIETLVALIVFGMIAGAVQLGLSATFRNTQIANEQEKALTHAKRILTEVGTSRPLMLGEQSGSIDDAMKWSIKVAPNARQSSLVLNANSEQSVMAPYVVDVSVSWSDASSLKERSVSLRTIKMGRTVP